MLASSCNDCLTCLVVQMLWPSLSLSAIRLAACVRFYFFASFFCLMRSMALGSCLISLMSDQISVGLTLNSYAMCLTSMFSTSTRRAMLFSSSVEREQRRRFGPVTLVAWLSKPRFKSCTASLLIAFLHPLLSLGMMKDFSRLSMVADG